jgi:Zn-dependent protease
MTETPRPRGVQVARVVGVPVLLRPSWFAFAIYLVLSGQVALRDRYGAAPAYWLALALVAMLLLSVLLHEVAHCLVARSYGLPVRSITVGLLAGVTEIMEPPQTPEREYTVAISGPMVSLLLCGIGVAGAAATDGESATWLVLGGLALTNGVLAGLNLLPGLPLDGGRVLRSVLWHRSGDALRATQISARSGMAIATLFIPVLVVGILPALGFGTPGLLSVLVAGLVGAFLYLGAATALRQAQAQSRLPTLTVEALARPALGVTAATPLAEAVRQAHEAGVRALVVLDGHGEPEGLVSEAWVQRVPWERRPWVSVGDGARRIEDHLVLAPTLAGEQLMAALQQNPATEYLVAGPMPRVLVSSDVALALSAAAVS